MLSRNFNAVRLTRALGGIVHRAKGVKSNTWPGLFLREQRVMLSASAGTGGGGGFAFVGGVAVGAASILAGLALQQGTGSNLLGTPAGAVAPDSSTESPSADTKEVKYGNAEDAAEEFIALLGADRVSLDKDDCYTHGHSDWSHHNEGLPRCVVYPESTEEVSKIMKICHKHRLPVVPYGGGTSLEGHFSQPWGGVSIDMQNMSDIVKLNEDDMDIVVQPGLKWEELNIRLKPYKLFFPMDPGPGASIGGMCMTRCSGTNAVRYGTMRDWVINMTVVLADGTIVKTAQRARKSSAGFDLTRLFVGSEGLLGVVTEVTLKLAVLPDDPCAAIIPFPTVKAAAEAVGEVVRKGIQVGCVELLDEVMVRCVNTMSGTKLAESPTLVFKFTGSPAQNEELEKDVSAIAAKHGAGTMAWAKTPDEVGKLWAARKGALWAAMAAKPEYSLWTTDVCVPVSRLADCISETKADLEKSFLLAPVVGHVGDGNFHLFIMFDPTDPKHVEEANRINNRMVARAIQMGGTCTGEHGVGAGKIQFLREELGDAAIELMWKLKDTIDPLHLMNPGKVLPPRDKNAPVPAH